jgi:hypothetical protein
MKRLWCLSVVLIESFLFSAQQPTVEKPSNSKQNNKHSQISPTTKRTAKDACNGGCLLKKESLNEYPKNKPDNQPYWYDFP